eukprot:1159332-Pelagomonas_calceolata.AAC.2
MDMGIKANMDILNAWHLEVSSPLTPCTIDDGNDNGPPVGVRGCQVLKSLHPMLAHPMMGHLPNTGTTRDSKAEY